MRIVLADDHRLVLEALEAYLKALRPTVEIVTAETLDGAVEAIAGSIRADLAIIDLNMPGMNGLDGLNVLRQRFPKVPVVLLSGNADRELIREALDKGAAGFIPKDLTGKSMLSALDLVLSGDRYVPQVAISEKEVSHIDPSSPLADLTPREAQILGYLMTGSANKEIARDLDCSEATVAFHLKNVYRKLDVNRRTQAVRKAINLGMQA